MLLVAAGAYTLAPLPERGVMAAYRARPKRRPILRLHRRLTTAPHQ